MGERRAFTALASGVALVVAATTSGAAPKGGKPKRPASVSPSVERMAAGAEEPPERPEARGTGDIPVSVVEVAGTQAYLQPGTRGGVRRGAKVVIHRKEYTVAQVTDSFAAIPVGDDPPREGDTGRATRLAETTTDVVHLAPPEPVSTWAHAWTEPVPPANRQTPRFVPLGGGERDRRFDVRMATSFGALLPLSARGANLVRAQLDARLHAEPFGAPAALDVDLAVQRWFDSSENARDGASARPTFYVRQLLASYSGGGFHAGLGRMRYAASTLGTLDGARGSASLGAGFTVGAFGGVLPNPLSGSPSLAATRFGVEAAYSRPDAAARPDAALVISGSTFDGVLDERRLSGVFNLYPGGSRIGAHFQVAAFDRDNPWKASTLEVTAAGVDASIRLGALSVEGRFDTRQPERSRWLASYLPAAWFCSTSVAPAGIAEVCDGKVSTLAQTSLALGIELDSVSFVASGTRTFDLTVSGAPSALGGFIAGRVVRIAKILRFDASANYSNATYVDMIGGSAGPGFSLLGDALDVSVYYRGSSLRYPSVSESLLQHAAGGTLIVIPSTSVLLAAQAEAIAGSDARALLLFGTVTWRPRL